jgi:hypothetical protein
MLATLAIGCMLASNASCADLWFANYANDTIEWFSAKQLKKSGTPVPGHFGLVPGMIGLGFDSSHNLWVTAGGGEVLKFKPAEVKKMPDTFKTKASKTITSSTFDDILGCAFDGHGNLWVTDTDDAFYEFQSAAQSRGLAYSRDRHHLGQSSFSEFHYLRQVRRRLARQRRQRPAHGVRCRTPDQRRREISGCCDLRRRHRNQP